MKKLLHVIASPRGEKSRSLKVAGAFLERFREVHPEWLIDELNVFDETLPHLTARQVDGKYVLLGGRELYGELRETWEEIEIQIARFKEADAYLISTPMWNFSLPYALKQYLDLIIQPRYLFRVVGGQTEGLLGGRRVVVINARGGDYRSPESCPYDHVRPYLHTILGFVGITVIDFITVEPLDGVSADDEAATVAAAQGAARAVAATSFAKD
ncbi:MAG: FMN-dependent NADH-azoreductase [Desulfuromonadales bacterium]